MRRLWLVGLSGFVLAGCTPSSETPSTPAGGQSFARELSAADRSACLASGGKVERHGRIQAETCVHAFADAGKACTDKADCQGKCVGGVEQSASTRPVAGQCQADDHLFGCYSEIKGGQALNAICVD